MLKHLRCVYPFVLEHKKLAFKRGEKIVLMVKNR